MKTKRLSVNQARKQRQEEIARLEEINPFTKPVKGVDSGASGKAFEIENALPHSRKIEVSQVGKVDGWLYIINELGEKKRQAVEFKTNGGRLENVLNLEDGKLVCYRLNVNNSNLKASYPPFITTKKNFLQMLENAKSIRTNALDRNGKPIPAIIQIKKSWSKEIEKYLSKCPRATYKEPGQVIDISDIL